MAMTPTNSPRMLGWLSFASLALACGCTGTPEPAPKGELKPAPQKASLAPNITVERKLENPLAPPGGRMMAQTPAPTREAKPDPKNDRRGFNRSGRDRRPEIAAKPPEAKSKAV